LPAHILLLEDEESIADALIYSLKAEGFQVTWCQLVQEASVQATNADLLILDVGLPDGNGFDLLHKWRAMGVKLPIIIITASAALDDRLAGLDSGADDFIVKPFAMAELTSRIRAVMRRYAQQASEVWELGELRIEPSHFRAYLNQQALDLSPREFRLLTELAREPGTVVAKDVLAQRLEPLGEPVNFGAMDVHIFNLRSKIGNHRIRTVRGVGYSLVL